MNMDYPPEVDAKKENKSEEGKDSLINLSERDSLFMDLKKYDEESFISADDFKNKFSLLLKNNSLYYEFSNKLEDLLNKSIDEEGIIEEYNYDHELEDQNGEIKKIINEKIDPYIDEIIFNYENGLFQEKIKIISFLSGIYFSSLFLNNFTTREKISKFFNQILESEKDDSGNYYISSHLRALFEKNEGSSLFAKISPDQYTTNRFVYDNKQNYGEGRDQTFVSKKEDFEEISKLIELIEGHKKKKEELYIKVENFFNKSVDKSEKEIDFDYNSKEPIVLEYLEIRDELDKNEELLNSYFTDELTESYFRPNIKAENYQNKFFDHKFFQYKSIRDNFKERAGFSLEETSVPEQYNYFEYTKNITNKEAQRVFNFLEKHGRNGFRTFLSIEQGGREMGDKILSLGEELPEDAAKLLFGKYSEYIDAVNSVEEVINKEYKLPPSPELINKTKESLLFRGRDLLLSQNKKLLNGQFSEEKFITSLENTKVGVDLFKNIFRIVKENNPDISFEDFSGLVPEQINSQDQITDEDILTIDKIIDKNYANDELRNAVKNSFHKAIESNSTILNLLRKNEDIIALDRIDHKEDGSLYFGSFNVNPDYCSSKIGAAFFEATVLLLMKDKIVKADCSAIQPIASYYIESGFVASSLYDYNSEPSFSLESVPGKKLISKDLTKSQIIESHTKDENIDGLIIKSASSQNEITEQKIPEGYSLTRYFFDKNMSKWLVVFEKTN